jgi:chemotaxis protein CheX
MENGSMITGASLADAVLDSAREVFDSMIFIPIEPNDPAPVAAGEAALLATITFTGEVKGCFGLCLDQPGARAVAAAMLCMDDTEDLTENDVIDAVGEIANMVMGGIKTRLQENVRDLEISIPSVIQGRDLVNRPGEGSEYVAIPVTIGGQYPAELSLLYRPR